MLLIYHPCYETLRASGRHSAPLCRTYKTSGVKATVLDANLEGLLHMLQAPVQPVDTWTRRSAANCVRHLADLRSGRTF